MKGLESICQERYGWFHQVVVIGKVEMTKIGHILQNSRWAGLGRSIPHLNCLSSKIIDFQFLLENTVKEKALLHSYIWDSYDIWTQYFSTREKMDNFHKIGFEDWKMCLEWNTMYKRDEFLLLLTSLEDRVYIDFWPRQGRSLFHIHSLFDKWLSKKMIAMHKCYYHL